MEKLLLFLNRPDLTQGAVDRAARRKEIERCAMRFIRVQPVATIDINPNRPLYIRATKMPTPTVHRSRRPLTSSGNF